MPHSGSDEKFDYTAHLSIVIYPPYRECVFLHIRVFMFKIRETAGTDLTERFGTHCVRQRASNVVSVNYLQVFRYRSKRLRCHS